MSWTIALPIIIPFALALINFLFRRNHYCAWLSIAGLVILLCVSSVLMKQVFESGVIAAQIGEWPAPFGITLVADLLSAVLVVITAIIGLAVAIFSVTDIDKEDREKGFYSLYHMLLAGIMGAFLTGDLFNLYVWFEVMLISSFSLLALGRTSEQVDGAVKYVVLNLISTVLFLMGIGLLYGLTGTLNMADLHLAVKALDNDTLVTTTAVIFIIAFGIKAAAFPLFFWLPASYHTPSFSVSAVFAGLLTKVGVYAMIRLFTLIFTEDVSYTHSILLVMACLTMVIGVLGAAAQSDVRKILSFHIVSQIGYMILGLALFTPLAILGAVFYIVHHIVVKCNLFLVAGVIHRLCGSTRLKDIGGVYHYAPLLSVLFLISAFSLAGFPPLSGFWAKFLLIKAAFDAEAWLMAGVALAVGLLTIYSMTKIWAETFWKDHPKNIEPRLGTLNKKAMYCSMIPVASLSIITVMIGVNPEPFVQLAQRSAEQLLGNKAYLLAVLSKTSLENGL